MPLRTFLAAAGYVSALWWIRLLGSALLRHATVRTFLAAAGYVSALWRCIMWTDESADNNRSLSLDISTCE
jgi:hypothetical protein